MRCPYCGYKEDKVVDSRATAEESAIRRRRECLNCKRRFTTYERVAPISLLVVKRDGRREEFDRDKLFEGIHRACTKRPIPSQVLQDMVDEIEAQLYASGQAEVESRAIGEMVMERLKKLDDVAYVRFASVYRRFKDVDGLVDEIEDLKRWQQESATEKRNAE